MASSIAGRVLGSALGYVVDDRNGPDVYEISDPTGAGHGLQFMKVPEAKAVKNRLHLDLHAPGSITDEVDRLIAAGATAIEQHEHPEGYVEPWEWTVLRDPEGNEFCVGLPRDGTSLGPTASLSGA